ncbi:MAG: winged helix-turn-helix domain-containing protein [Armatimonadota bacterium]
MQILTITRQEARRFILAYQGLWPSYEFDGKQGILSYINRVGCIQFDPLDVVGRNAELVLQSRVDDYKPVMLNDLLYTDRRLVDGYDKMMSIYLTEDWPFFHRGRESARTRHGGDSGPFTQILPKVRKEIQERGPVSSKDLDYDQNIDWPWGPTRMARAVLESMYLWGELVIHHKVHTRKVYDFAHRHISDELLTAPDPNVTEEQYQDWYLLRRIGSVGLLWDLPGGAWLGMPGYRSNERRATLFRLVDQNKVVQISVEDISAPFYVRIEDMDLLDTVLSRNGTSTRAAILAPLDNLLWDRRLVKVLFDFDYCWEVYKPVAERNYGYYVLPVLHGDRFVARFEPGRDKKSRVLIIKNWWWEPGIERSEQMDADIRRCFEKFLKYLGADQLHIPEDIKIQSVLDSLSIS